MVDHYWCFQILKFMHLNTKHYLLALPIGEKLQIYARFGLGYKKFAHLLANVEMTIVHRMKIFQWM
jgi:hypothetical protein